MTPPFPTQRPSDLAREDLYFDLDGTSRALDTLLDCVERANALSSPGNPFADARSTSANPFAGNDSRAGSNDQDIVEGLLLASGLQDIVFVDPATTGFGDALHTWQAGELTGADGNFSSGGDVHEIIGPLTAMAMPELLAFTRMTGDLVKAIRACPQPVICALDGVCVGAGAIDRKSTRLNSSH